MGTRSNFASSPGVEFLNSEAVFTLFKLLKPYRIEAKFDQQGFLDTLQQIGEIMDLMPLQSEELDDWVPREVVHRWVKQFIRSYANLFGELNLESSLVGPD